MAAPARAAAPATGHGAPAPAGGGPRRVAVWVLADRRVADNPALVAAARAAKAAGVTGACVPVFEGGVGEHGVSGLVDGLQGLGSGLVVVDGKCGQGVLEVVQRLGLGAVYFNRAIDESDVRRQVEGVKVLEAAGVTVRGFWGNVLVEPKEGEKEVAGAGARYAAVVGRKELPRPEAAPRSLPRLPRDAGAVLGGADGGVSVEKLLAVVAKGGRAGGEAVWTLRSALRAGVVSARMVAARIVGVCGKFEGALAGEVMWRDYVAAAVHEKLGVRDVAKVGA